jgi:hypothetical protein
MPLRIPRFLIAVLAACCLCLVASAADPSGTWTWQSPGRGGQTRTSTLKLALKDGALSGTVSGFRGGQNAISDASFKDPAVAVTVKITFGDNEFVIKYAGKLSGDTITGTIEVPGRDGGEPRKMPWKAKRGGTAAAASAPAPAT